MKASQPILFAAALIMIGLTAGLLAHAKSNQRLGEPGVLTAPLPDGRNLQVLVPTNLPGYTATLVPTADVVLHTLPSDTSYGQCLYQSTNGFQALVNVVLMGSSRRSIHKPQVCLTAQGWNIDDSTSRERVIHMTKPVPYDLHVMLLVASRTGRLSGQSVTERGLYAYWFADEDRLTALHSRRMLWTTYDVIFREILDRWSYVSFFTICLPGQEDAAFERMKDLIVTSVPQFQLVPQKPN